MCILIVPSTVNNLTCYALSSTQVHVAWQPPSQPNGIIRHYEIILHNINTLQSSSVFVTGNKTSVTLDHLHPNYQYSCYVAAHSVTRGNLTSFTQNISLPQSGMCSLVYNIIL